MSSQSPQRIKRCFVDLPHGQIHCRTAGLDLAGTPLIMLHASPGSSKQLEPLIAGLGDRRPTIAPDCPGNGDSDPVPEDVPTIDGLADVLRDAIDGFVPSAGRFDLYGSHTGARLACSIALRHPHQVRRIVLDGFGLYTTDERDEILATYAPEQAPDDLGQYLMWGWHFARDQWIWFPWFDKTIDRRVTLDLPSADFLHDLFVEIMKSVRTYHRSYRAAFRYDMKSALPKLGQPTLICAQKTDMIHTMLPRMAALLPSADTALLPGTATLYDTNATVAKISDFLDQDPTAGSAR
jgi:pimeloyl-ACP methyl ester carboxylesterase